MSIPVKLTRANQVTLPKRLLERAGWLHQHYFVADLEGGALVLKPMKTALRPPVANLAELRRHFASLGITSCDVSDAVAWARRPARQAPSRRRTRR